ncbi:hypothetical protein [Asanoa iriomotensis]|uniref:FXSXX-COOH protein n=1 Tax=Asanoa iriomotensis TaxID=234613 RepID=A0ABQ4CE66_9ACTN|nr:hypothetical protein [Asanoa iriomotensis]GIF61053.1 hypothetical protein Air01nite_71480 [Asanoa iriomotensis]
MTLAKSQDTPDPVPVHGLVDVSDARVADLLATDESAFGATFRQFLAEAADPTRTVFAAFQSVLSPDE